MAKDTPSMAKNKMRRCLAAILDPHPSRTEIDALWQYFDSRCAYCGLELDRVARVGHIDHIFPTSEGGTNDIHNHVLACAACNGDEKRERPWKAFLMQKAKNQVDSTSRAAKIEEWLSRSPGRVQLDEQTQVQAAEIVDQAITNFEAAVERMRTLRNNDT